MKSPDKLFPCLLCVTILAAAFPCTVLGGLTDAEPTVIPTRSGSTSSGGIHYSDGITFTHDEQQTVDTWGPHGVYEAQIWIDRYFGTRAERETQIRQGLLPKYARLSVPNWDCDINSTSTDVAPEYDNIYLNGKFVATLKGDNNKWNNEDYDIPIQDIVFPEYPGDVGINTLKIVVDTVKGSQAGWKLGQIRQSITIDAPPPVLIVHGWTDDLTSVTALQEQLRKQFGIPSQLANVLKNNSTADNARLLKSQIEQMTAQYKVSQVNILAHSKGGLDSRYLVDTRGLDCQLVRYLLQVATPNGGSKMAETDITLHHPSTFFHNCLLPKGQELDTEAYYPGVAALQPEVCRCFNRSYASPSAAISTIIGDCKNYSLLQWGEYYLLGRYGYHHDYTSSDPDRHGDGMVSLTSAHCIRTADTASPLEDTGDHNVDHSTILTVSADRVLEAYRDRLSELSGASAVHTISPSVQERSSSGATSGEDEDEWDDEITQAPAYQTEALFDYAAGSYSTHDLPLIAEGTLLLTSSDPGISVKTAVITPDGRRFPMTATTGLLSTVRIAEIDSPECGTYRLEIDAREASSGGSLHLLADGGKCLCLQGRVRSRAVCDDSALIEARFRKNSTIGELEGISVEAAWIYTDDDGTTASPVIYPLHDDGLAGDSTAGDGIYSLRLSDLRQGKYRCVIRGTGECGGLSFERSLRTEDIVAAPISVSMPSEAEITYIMDGKNAMISSFEALFPLTATVSGTYLLSGTLISPYKKDLGTISTRGTLQAGIPGSLALQVPARKIYDCGKDGRYSLKDLRVILLEDSEKKYSDIDITSLPDLSITAPNLLNCEHPPFIITEIVDESIPDADSERTSDNNIYSVKLRLSVAPGYGKLEYHITGTLVDSEGTKVAGSHTANLILYDDKKNPKGTVITLDFRGQEIFESGKDGPYVLNSVSLLVNNYGSLSALYRIEPKIKLKTKCDHRLFNEGKHETKPIDTSPKLNFVPVQQNQDGTCIQEVTCTLDLSNCKTIAGQSPMYSGEVTCAIEWGESAGTAVQNIDGEWKEYPEEEALSGISELLQDILCRRMMTWKTEESVTFYLMTPADFKAEDFHLAIHARGYFVSPAALSNVFLYHSSDTDMDYTISREEVAEAIRQWKACTLNNDALLETLYLSGSPRYLYDSATRKFSRDEE